MKKIFAWIVGFLFATFITAIACGVFYVVVRYPLVVIDFATIFGFIVMARFFANIYLKRKKQ